MPDRLLLSRYRLSTFAACRRRFQLRYLQRLAWPAAPRALPLQMALERGEAFHRLVERYYLGLPPFAEDAGIPDEKLSLWWRAFRQSGPEMPAGKRLTEYTLTVPIGPHFLTGRFDLLVLTGDGAHIFDWKTEARPRTAAVLRDDLQTLLYLAMVTEGATALGADGPINPDHVRITYWYATDPAASVTLGYSRRQHDVHAGAIRQTRVHHWRALIEPAAEQQGLAGFEELLSLEINVDDGAHRIDRQNRLRQGVENLRRGDGRRRAAGVAAMAVHGAQAGHAASLADAGAKNAAISENTSE